MNDTIAAIATSSGVGAISIIRVSGNDSINIVNKIFDKDLLNKESHTITYGHIINNEEIIDEVLVTIMKGPKSFTTEDIVEINAHGGYATTNEILKLLLLNGCRLANKGEFTQRAFINGRIDLVEAESVMDIINSKTKKESTLALNQLTGKVSKKINDLRNKLLDIDANINVNIDFPEYQDIKVYETMDLKNQINDIEEELRKILKESNNCKIIKEGITTAIIGKPNVGKSSLLNSLIEEEKAIVTEIAGTTRDIVEGNILIDGVSLNIIDTAGIRKTEDIVESIGVKKSLEYIEKADLILFVLNNNEEITKEELDILNEIKNKKYLLIINKIDLENKLNIDLLDKNKIVYISVKEEKGIDELKEKISNLFKLNDIKPEDLTYLSSARAISLVEEATIRISDIKKGIEDDVPIDMVEIDIKYIIDLLGQVIGKNYQDDLLDTLFSNFCLGK